MQKKEEPQVGIVFLVGGELFIDSTPVSFGGIYGDFRIHEGSHIEAWHKLGIEGEYEYWPRARVSFDTRTQEFTLLADVCILRRKDIVDRILKEMNLPIETVRSGDSHYRCQRTCLRR